MTRIATLLTLGLIAIILVPNARSQSCSGNSEINGAYALLGTRTIFASVPVNPPGTNGSTSTGSPSTGSTSTGSTGTPVVSATPIGSLIGGVIGTAPFSVVGRVAADGAGNLFAAPNASISPQQIGTYNVNPDCTITVTLNDVFVGISLTPPGTSGASTGNNTGTGMGTGTGNNSGSSNGNGTSSGFVPATTGNSTGASIQLEGLILGQGAQIDLVQSGTSNTGATVSLQRVYEFGGCTDATLTGAFGLVAQITSTGMTGSGTTGTTGDNGSLTTASFVGRLDADGAGMFTTDALAAQSPLAALQLTGSYTVNADCSGTAQFTNNSGMTYSAGFVIVQPLNGSVTTSLQRSGPELLLTFTNQTSSATTTVPGSGTDTGNGTGTGTGSTGGNTTNSGISGSGVALHE